MKGRKIPSWDEYFMLQALMAKTRSKDPSTQVGCVIVDNENHQVSFGYNGFPAGIDESKLTWERDPNLPFHEQKYAYVMHAEDNAVNHSGRANLKDCTVYVTLFPCNECAKKLVSMKIKKVVYLSDKDSGKPFNLASKKMLEAAGVEAKQFKFKKDSTDYLKDLVKEMNEFIE